MKADPYDIKTVFGFERQLFAPLFQRPYVWKKKEQWEPLWLDVQRVAEELLKNNYDCKPHFLGAVVLDQMRVPIGRPDARSSMQQRPVKGGTKLRTWSSHLSSHILSGFWQTNSK